MKTGNFNFGSLSVRRYLGLSAAVFALAILPGCSDDDLSNDGNGEPIPDSGLVAEGVNVFVKNNPSLATSYRISRASVDGLQLKMPAAPTADELKAMNQMGAANDPWNLPQNYNGTPVFYLTNGYCKNVAGSSLFNNVTAKYYIDSPVTLTGDAGCGNKEIYVLPGGELSCPTGIPAETTIFVYEGGKIVRAGEEGQIYISGTLISEADVNADRVTLGGTLSTTGKISGKNVELNGGNMYAGCAVTATEKIYITGTKSTLSAGYIAAPAVELAGGNVWVGDKLNIVIRDGGYLHAANNLFLKNFDCINIAAEEGGKAMVETKNLEVNGWDLTNTFSNVAIKYTERTGTDEREPQFNETCMVNENVSYTTTTTEDACAPVMVVDPTETPDPTPETPETPEIENVGSLEGPDHDHEISATCIYTTPTDAYISWHTQGKDFHGCIEHATIDGGKVTLKAYLETSADNTTYGAVDFNHVIYDNGKIFVAGDHPDRGGILGWIDCEGGTFPSNNTAELNMRTLFYKEYMDDKGETKASNGGSGNCIIRNGDYYQVASVAGFETFNVADFVKGKKFKPVAQLGAWNFKAGAVAPSPAWARDHSNTGKHIATDGKNVVMLTLINRDDEKNTANASIKVYAASDVNYLNPIASYVEEDQILSPVNGKDVIAIDGNDIYVCLGKGGVKHYTISGTTLTEVNDFLLTGYTKVQLKKEWGLTEKEAASACANGLAVDANYVYVAHGGAGLIVLDRSTLKPVTHTRNHGKASANYIALQGDYIYVAYGLSKVQVYSLKK